MHFQLRWVAALIAIVASVSAPARGLDVYRIGNSLTWDSQPPAIAKIAEQRGHEHVVGWHIKCGSPLISIRQNPEVVCVKPPMGTYLEALSKRKWDVVTIQYHPGKDSTLATDVACVLHFIEEARKHPDNRDTVFYLYSAWPARDLGDYATVWQRDIADDEATPTAHARQYAAHLLKRVRAATDAKVRVIPAGEVLFRLHEKMKAGKAPGYDNVHQLYRDRVHLTHELGRYVAGVTVFSTLYNENPAGLTKPVGTYRKAGKDWPLPEPLAKLIHETVWEVVSGDSASSGE